MKEEVDIRAKKNGIVVDPKKRAEAITRLASKKRGDPFPQLLEALADGHVRVRGAAFHGMLDRDPDRTLKVLVERSSSQEPGIRRAAFSGLTLAADPALGEEFHQDYLHHCLQLMEEATSDPDLQVRERALTAFLVGAPLSTVVERACVEGLQQSDFDVVDVSLRMLEKMGSRAPQAAVGSVRQLLIGEHALAAIHTLGAMGPQAAEALGDLRRLQQQESLHDAVETALGLILVENGAHDFLPDLDSEDVLARGPAVGQVGQQDLEAAFDRLLVCLSDSNPVLREAAATALATLAEKAVAQLVSQESLRALQTLAESSHRDDFMPALQSQALPLARHLLAGTERLAALSLLVSLDCQDAELYTQALDDSHERVVELAVLALQRLGPRAALAVPRLAELLDTLHQVDAAKALGAIGELAVDALPHLKRRLRGGDQAMRSQARLAIQQIEGPRLGDASSRYRPG